MLNLTSFINQSCEISVKTIPLNEFECTCGFFLILEIEAVECGKHSSKTGQESWLNALTYDVSLKTDHPVLNMAGCFLT